ncbi:MAG: aldehyde dehydrogenase family protein, partial [Candidatus Sumerlaeia bacterium]|nr:aldehyde dehydrogenase family protein [Candidatus Sumerlaeia bacterium]
KRAGAKLLCGGTRRGQVIAPTLLAGVPPSLPVSCQEVFGPVAVVETWDDFDDVLRRVNDSAYGLQAGVFTRDLHRAAQAFRDLEVGGVVVNNTPTFRIDHQPYGGEKDSGLGREGIRWAIEEMTTVRILSLNTGP